MWVNLRLRGLKSSSYILLLLLFLPLSTLNRLGSFDGA